MELSFVVKALQRRWWIIVLFSLIGAVPGSLVGNDDSAEFQSEAVLIVSPPSTSGTITFLSEPDRYVQGQLNVLSSVSLAEDVARAIGDDTVSPVRDNTNFTQIDDTDVVVIESRSNDPERAQRVAQAFAEALEGYQRHDFGRQLTERALCSPVMNGRLAPVSRSTTCSSLQAEPSSSTYSSLEKRSSPTIAAWVALA